MVFSSSPIRVRPNGSRLSCGASAGGRKRPALRYELVGAQTYASFESRPRQLQALVRPRALPNVAPLRPTQQIPTIEADWWLTGSSEGKGGVHLVDKRLRLELEGDKKPAG